MNEFADIEKAKWLDQVSRGKLTDVRIPIFKTMDASINLTDESAVIQLDSTPEYEEWHRAGSTSVCGIWVRTL